MNGKKARMLRQLAKILHDQYPHKSERGLYKAVKRDYKAGRLMNG